MADTKDDLNFESKIKKIQNILLNPITSNEKIYLLNNWELILKIEFDLTTEDQKKLSLRKMSIYNVNSCIHPQLDKLDTSISNFQIDLGKMTNRYMNKSKFVPFT